MSIETTQYITKEECQRRILNKLTEKMVTIQSMSNTELEDCLYDLTRESNQFDNYIISERSNE